MLADPGFLDAETVGDDDLGQVLVIAQLRKLVVAVAVREQTDLHGAPLSRLSSYHLYRCQAAPTRTRRRIAIPADGCSYPADGRIRQRTRQQTGSGHARAGGSGARRAGRGQFRAQFVPGIARGVRTQRRAAGRRERRRARPRRELDPDRDAGMGRRARRRGFAHQQDHRHRRPRRHLGAGRRRARHRSAENAHRWALGARSGSGAAHRGGAGRQGARRRELRARAGAPA